MNLHELGSGFFVSPQIELSDIALLNEKGIKTIICNRPDDEDIGQTSYDEIAQKAAEYGIQCYFLPITPPQITLEDAQQMMKILQDGAYPMLAYCRSGTRSTYLYQLAKNM